MGSLVPQGLDVLSHKWSIFSLVLPIAYQNLGLATTWISGDALVSLVQSIQDVKVHVYRDHQSTAFH